MQSFQGPIYCIGDSHVGFFSGVDKIKPIWPGSSKDTLPFFKVFHLGPVLAYNLNKLNTTTRGREKLFELLHSEIPPGSKVMLSFGEIDCRAHLLKQTLLQERSINSIVAECVDNYFSVLLELKKMGYEMLVWNVIPSTILNEITNKNFPVYGTCKERNIVSELFNNCLSKLCSENGVTFISIFDELIDEGGLTRMDLYMDNVHLSQKVMPVTIKRIEAALNANLDYLIPDHKKVQNDQDMSESLPFIGIEDIAPPLGEPVNFITDHINLPSPPRPQFRHDDMTPLLRIIKALNPEIIFEFGTAYGNTTANICAICEAHIFTVNALPEQLSGRYITVAMKKEDIGSVYRKYGYQHRVTQIYENTLKFDHTKYFNLPCIGLAIVDACHDTDYVINDFMKILPVLNEKAIVLFHDTHPSRKGHLSGSYNACVQLRKQGFDIRHIENTWWAIWQKNQRGAIAEKE